MSIYPALNTPVQTTLQRDRQTGRVSFFALATRVHWGVHAEVQEILAVLSKVSRAQKKEKRRGAERQLWSSRPHQVLLPSLLATLLNLFLRPRSLLHTLPSLLRRGESAAQTKARRNFKKFSPKRRRPEDLSLKR